ncbi:MAG: flagellar hook assembly protein FlgD [Caulobacteraceae bacterium]|nr:flagellar hook assembly protein FlgD [Caulobacter sp.]RYF95746.1 MAG: flagellar hook assembly protein FlgD [Caulobacteraceae bacterium]
MVDSVSSGTNVLDKITDSRTRLADSTETFLSLLTTQLKNQDPLSPMDSSQFTQQIVQMTGVEQQLLTNDLLAALVGMSDGGLADSVNLIGKTVTATTAAASLADGKATWAYNLPRAATEVTMEVIDSTGKTVASKALTGVGSGNQTFAWDGKSNLGTQLPDGEYGLRITATDSAGAKISAIQTLTGVATGVQAVDGTNIVTIGKTRVPISAVTAVSNTI